MSPSADGIILGPLPTKPLARADRFELAKIPGSDTIDLRDSLG